MNQKVRHSHFIKNSHYHNLDYFIRLVNHQLIDYILSSYVHIRFQVMSNKVTSYKYYI